MKKCKLSWKSEKFLLAQSVYAYLSVLMYKMTYCSLSLRRNVRSLIPEGDKNSFYFIWLDWEHIFCNLYGIL